MMRFCVLPLVSLFLFVGCLSSKQVAQINTATVSGAALQPFGRTRLRADGALELIASAAHFSVRFSDTACDVVASLPDWLDHNYVQYELDGVYQKRLRITKMDSLLHIPIPGGGTHTLTIYKATEAQTGAVFIKTVSARNIKTLAPPAAPLIEFIGNSITCGAAADPSEVPCGTGVYHDQHNAFMAYGPRVARALNVNFIMSSVSGIGIYRNWNSDGPTMPQVYERWSLNATDTAAWAFEKYSPKVVSIALGTNDFSKGDGKKPRLPFDSVLFVARYVDFVNTVQAKYPQAQLVLLSSPMVRDSARTLLQNCLAAVKTMVDAHHATAKPLALYFFNPMQARGCSGHPSVEDHAVLADELLPFFKTLLRK